MKNLKTKDVNGLIVSKKLEDQSSEVTEQQAVSQPINVSTAIERRDRFCGSLNDALKHSAAQGDVEVVALLLNDGAYIETMDLEGVTPLHVAASHGYYNVVKLFLDRGAEIDRGDAGGHTALHKAAYAGAKDIAQLLISRGADVNATGTDMSTPLQQASMDSHLPLVKLLLDQGAEVNLADLPTKRTPLSEAAFYGHAKVVELLLARGAEHEGTDSHDTPLYRAAKMERLSIVRMLLDKGANTSYCYWYLSKSQSEAVTMIAIEHKIRRILEGKDEEFHNELGIWMILFCAVILIWLLCRSA